MKFTTFAKFILSYTYNKIGLIENLLKKNCKENRLILMYHRILANYQVDTWIQPGMYVIKDTFEMHINYLKKYFDIIPLATLIKDPWENDKQNRKKPKCSITFDDGWHDFYINAFPLIKKHNIPVTVFLPTGYINTNRWFWTDRLMMIFLQAKKKGGDYSKKITDHIIDQIKKDKFNIKSERDIEAYIDSLKLKNAFDIENLVAFLENLIEEKSIIPGRSFLNWDEIRELKKSKLVEFGSHTTNHLILTSYSEKEIKYELESSIDTIKQMKLADNKNIPFCYPNGNANESIAKIVQSFGFDCAVTTKKGWIHYNDDKYLLKRIGIHQDSSFSESMFGLRIAIL